MISEIITKATKFNMPLGNRNCILRIMNIIGTQDSISYVRMVNDKGITAFSSEKGDIGKSVLKSNESCNICHIPGNNVINMDHAQSFRIYHSNGDDVLGVMTPIYNSPNCYSTSECHVHSRETKKLGILDVRMSLSGVRKELKRSFFTFTIFLFLVLLCFIIVTAIVISRFVTSPVKQMVAGTKKVADGDLNVDIKVRSKDEIGQLAISFNLMIIDLKIAHEEIRNWSMRLEKKIEERTRKLYLTRAKLIQSEKMASLGVLASSVAHEINNPLQGILTYIKLMLKILKGGKPTDKNLKDFDEYLVLMGNEIERCGGMVKNLLVFSKQSKLEIREEDINSIIDNALKLVENKVKLQNIHILTELG
ncbi:MAG: HAMP domain-containing protein, partial [Candidatus Aminicenantes bacterium]|nr:HAMP domain-containing protein [Candidatus Aminicenantes bacterium]